MKMFFDNKQITGILAILPETISCFDDEIENYPFPVKQSKRLKKVMGFDKHRLSKESSTASDFCVYGLKSLLDSGKIKKEEIGAIVVVSISPDYFMPNISGIIHGECELDEKVICIDIPQACCGFLYGFMQSCMLLQHMENKKVLLFNTDVLSHKISRKDRSNFPLTGDATTITIFENKKTEDKIYLELCTDGKNREALMIPAGGFALPCSEQTAVEEVQEDGNIRSLEQLKMDGAAVFDFVTNSIPPVFNDALQEMNISREDIDYYLFHQPNKFLLSKLADELEIPYEKTFMNIVENFGNPHGSTIPLNIAFNLGEEIKNNKYKCCLAAFGAGLSYGVAITELGKLDFCEIIESNL